MSATYYVTWKVKGETQQRSFRTFAAAVAKHAEKKVDQAKDLMLTAAIDPVEVTPAMIEAGKDAMLHLKFEGGDHYGDAVRQVLEAALKARSK